ncbi:acyl-CoA-binding domain-containing protein 4-like isoform X1 [Cucurbita moschata]|uniref:Acyl-CoA-binding domain-containing protein 4-like isoform X1 n=1 Tax=Cucurbita moschata TaxID=3662 RepID=A0A6J1FHF3_CUCMO|nr:acyl-CoA-binding domain-containing protein 4-like isoform X1 [Cucurbita moschata]
MDVDSWRWGLAYDQWVALPVTGSRPPARYKHAAAVVDEKLYIVGGSRNGRYLSDVQVLNLSNFSWSALKLQMNPGVENSEGNGGLVEALPPIAGHSMVKWDKKLIMLGGNLKGSSDRILVLAVHCIDLETDTWSVMETSGKVPIACAGHSATLFGSKIIMFGGEDSSRRLINDIHVLDLETLTWDLVETKQTPPAPRFDHTAAMHADHYLLVFGGCSHSAFFSDLHVLDFHTMEWSQPQIQGDLATPRAGHAGITIDENWYIVGGGDNKNGCPETIVLNMSKLSWLALTSVKQREPLASEGISISLATIDVDKYLVAFGGYNGKYNNEVFIMRPKPRDSSRPKIFQSPAAAAAAASVTAAYALAKTEKLDFAIIEDGVSKGREVKHSQPNDTIELEALREEKANLELTLAEVHGESSKLKQEIDEVNSTHAELSKEFQSVQGQLIAERSRCFKLEAQIAELQKMLESMQSIENEVQLLREQKSALEKHMEDASSVEKQAPGGVWRWIAGGNN